MNIKKFPVNPFPVNMFIVSDEKTKECVLIDPGCYYAEEFEAVDDYIAKEGLKVKGILLTHLHLDHALGVPYFAEKYNVDFCANGKDAFLLNGAAAQAQQYGLKLEHEPIAISKELKEGDTIKIGDEELAVLEVPGHSPGSLVYYSKDKGVMFAGDVLFMGSIGRTDLPGGDYNTLIDGIKSKLLTLPENTVICSGHGPESNIGYEKKNNSFLR